MVTCPKCGAANAEGSRYCGDCGARQGVVLAPLAGAVPRRAPAGRLPAGTVIDQKYVIERVLGEGGMGVVYLAHDVLTDLHVVLKAVRQELAHRADVRARTLAEGRALAAIDHPNVVHLNAVVEGSDGLWLVMQYIDGESLDHTIARRVEEGRPIPFDEAFSIFRQITSGIAAAHREGVIHRDLKPANVMIRRKDGVAKVTDFGIAKEEADALAGRGQTKGIIGSLYYMSPEQVTGRRDLDKRVDIYALGILLYEMLVGRVPFDAESDNAIMRLHTEAPMPSVREVRPDVPAEIDTILQKACAKDRAVRFSSCEELLAAIEEVARTARAASNSSSADPAAEERGGAGRRRGLSTTVDAAPLLRRRWPAIAASVIVLACGAAAALVALGVLPMQAKGRPRETPEIKGGAAAPSARPAESAAPIPAPPRSPLVELAGAWVGNKREIEAVLTGDTLEFRVVRAEQFAPQDYQAGEARFSLREIPGEARVFAVEDRIRFIAPAERTFDPARSRGTCQDVRSAVDGRPLRATYDGIRLSVEFARIEPHEKNFVIERGRVVSCVGLGALPASRVVSTLTRP